MAALLELKGVSLSFGGLRVVSELDLRSARARSSALIGPNGAGKTTLFNLVTGVYEPDEGEILLDGRNIAGLAPHKINHLGVARTFQTLRLFLNMSVKENVMAAAYGNEGRALPGDAADARDAARGARDRRARRGAARVLRRAADGLPLEPARVLALVREPAPARDRAGDGDAAADPAARRAGRRDEPRPRRTRSPS